MEDNVIAQIWDTITQVNPPPELFTIIVTAIAAVAVIAFRPLWRWGRNVITIVHEGGHAFVAVLTGRRLRGVRLHSDTSGLTYSAGDRRGFSAIATLFAGYVAPAALGLLSAWLISTGYVVLLLWLNLVLLAALALFIRNLYGMVATGVTGLVIFATVWWADAEIQSFIVYAGTWFLLFGAVRPVWETWAVRHRGQRQTDPDQLARITAVPAVVWLVLFAMLNLGALVLGIQLLTPQLWQQL